MREIDEKHNGEIFENDSPETVASIVCYLVHLLGGEVKFPLDPKFWDNAMPGDMWLTLHKEADSVVLRANQRKGNNETRS